MPRTAHTPTLPCTRCGYDLVGLDVSAPCPECAVTNAGARAHRVLAGAEPRRLRALSVSIQFVGWCYVGVGLLGASMLLMTTTALGATGGFRSAGLSLVALGTTLAVAGAYLASIVSAFVFAGRLLHPVGGRPRLAWCITIAAVLAGIGIPAQFLLGGWFWSGLWPRLNVFSWPFYLVHVLLVLSLHLVLLLVAIGLASWARDVQRTWMTYSIACLFALKCLGVALSLAADAVDAILWNHPGGSLARWAYSMQTQAAWAAWAWPWFDQLCMLLLGLAALPLARALARQSRQALANADTTQMPPVQYPV